MKKIQSKPVAVAAIVSVLLSCQKITTPNEESKKIFGSWSYKWNSGGFTGGGGSVRFSDDSWVEITEKGCFRVYAGSKKKSQLRFKLEMKKSIYTGKETPALVYKGGDYETYRISNDTLYLSDERYDGYTYCFIRK